MAHVAHVAAHAEEETKRNAEEEEMTSYNHTDIKDDWEFKIVRSATGKFKNPEMVELLRAEEAMAGWKLVEKFDDSRIRFKRLANAYRKDATLPQGLDPYRTQIGISEGGLAVRILLVVFSVIGLILGLLYFAGELN